jgi:hypothetical protein
MRLVKGKTRNSDGKETRNTPQNPKGHGDDPVQAFPGCDTSRPGTKVALPRWFLMGKSAGGLNVI